VPQQVPIEVADSDFETLCEKSADRARARFGGPLKYSIDNEIAEVDRRMSCRRCRADPASGGERAGLQADRRRS